MKNNPKPKFKPGDVIINHLGYLRTITSIKNGSYHGTSEHGVWFGKCDFIEENWKLWTVYDAKPGDVLWSNGFSSDCVFIFNGIDNWKFDEPNGDRAVATAYCCITLSSDKLEFGIQGPDCIEISSIKPATKKQRTLLFSEMKKAGYEWDAENLKLNKIMHKFNVGDLLIHNYSRKCNTIESIDDYFGYQLKHKDKFYYLSLKAVEENYHLWTINDAKPGDILAWDDCGDEYVFIFSHVYHDMDEYNSYVQAYCGINRFLTNKFEITEADNKYYCISELKPATEEQIEALFKRIKEEGYEWDAEKLKLTERIPKFNIGDWIIHNHTKIVAHIESHDNYYGYQISVGTNLYHLSDDSVEQNYHIWTIDDAKPGDVLCTYECGLAKIVFILKNIPQRPYILSYFCYYNMMWPSFATDEQAGCLAPLACDVKPATSEQSDLLFQKITKNDYEWDAKNLQLTKKRNFNVGDWIVMDDKAGRISVELIMSINNGQVKTVDKDGDEFTFTETGLKHYHLWTISDVKAGDVLMYENEIFIFKNRSQYLISYYCCYDGNLLIDSMYSFTSTELGYVRPANHKEKQLLFDEMKKAGYEWDQKEKQLMKIKKDMDKRIRDAELREQIQKCESQMKTNAADFKNDGLTYEEFHNLQYALVKKIEELKFKVKDVKTAELTITPQESYIIFDALENMLEKISYDSVNVFQSYDKKEIQQLADAVLKLQVKNQW